MFEGFHAEIVDTGEARIFTLRAGDGPPVLLLHGFPQTHVMWHRVAPLLAEHHSVVVADLRGYGQSSAPPTTDDHEPYSKRAMARDAVAVMRHFGHERFALAGHDRGGRVAYRAALDHPDRIGKLAVLDIVPTAEVLARMTAAVAFGYWHWTFLAQPNGLPEKLIGADPEAFFGALRAGVLNVGPGTFTDETLEIYRRQLLDPARVHAMCEDYRAGYGADTQADEADRGVRTIDVPTLVLWGRSGALHNWYDVLDVWREWAPGVTGEPVDSGHFLPEEAPQQTADKLLAFLDGTG